MIECDSQARRTVILQVARDASIDAVEMLMETAIRKNLPVKAKTDLLSDVLRFDPDKHDNNQPLPVFDLFSGKKITSDAQYHNHPLNLGFFREKCNPDLCSSCFWNTMCEMESGVQLTQQQFNDLMANYDKIEKEERIRKATDTEAKKNEVEPLSNAEIKGFWQEMNLRVDGKKVPEWLERYNAENRNKTNKRKREHDSTVGEWDPEKKEWIAF